MAQPPETRFTRAGDVDIAYQVLGSASQLDLLFVPGLVLGSGITFADRGEHSLKGVPGKWQLFAVENY